MAKKHEQKSKIDQPNDKFFKEVMSQRDAALSYLYAFLPQDLREHLLFETLELSKDSYVTPELETFFSDIVYTCGYSGKRKVNLTITFLYEHKSQPDKYIHLQLLKYILGIWEAQRKGRQKLTIVVPLVFYHGDKHWKKRDLVALFPGIDELLKPFVPEFEYLLTDLETYSELDILAVQESFLASALLAMKYRYNEAVLKSRFGMILTLANGDSPNFLKTVFVYLLQVMAFEPGEVEALLEHASKETKLSIMTTYEKIIQKGKQEGIQEGIQKGRLEGKEAGRQEGEMHKTRQTIINMAEKGFDTSLIAQVLEVSEGFVKTVLTNPKGA